MANNNKWNTSWNFINKPFSWAFDACFIISCTPSTIEQYHYHYIFNYILNLFFYQNQVFFIFFILHKLFIFIYKYVDITPIQHEFNEHVHTCLPHLSWGVWLNEVISRTTCSNRKMILSRKAIYLLSIWLYVFRNHVCLVKTWLNIRVRSTGTVPVNFGKINLCKNKHFIVWEDLYALLENRWTKFEKWFDVT